MNKKDLKIGVEYAITFEPNAIRNGRDARVFKATVIGIDVTAKRWERRGGGEYSESNVTGIEIDAPYSYKAYTYERDEQGRYIYTGGGNGYRGQPVTKNFEASYETRILESAKFVVSTWADWEARQKRDAEAKVARERAAEDAARKRTELHPLTVDQAKRVLTAIGAEGDLTGTKLGYGERSVKIGTTVVGEIKWGRGLDAEPVLLGIDFRFSLSMLASILGTEGR